MFHPFSQPGTTSSVGSDLAGAHHRGQLQGAEVGRLREAQALEEGTELQVLRGELLRWGSSKGGPGDGWMDGWVWACPPNLMGHAA